MSLVDFTLPALGADMERGTLTQWLKRVGDPVRRGEAIAVVETEKGLIDIEAFDDGVLAEVVASPQSVLPVGSVLARIETKAAAASVSADRVPVEPHAPVATAPARAVAMARPKGASAAAASVQPSAAGAEKGTAAPDRRRVSPTARRRAAELGIDLATIAAVGADGVVHVADVERAARPKADMRSAIGAAMARSKREIPHYYLAHAIDFGPARAWLASHNAAVPIGERLIDTVLLIKAVGLAAAEIDGVNGHYADGRFQRSAVVNVGAAIAIRGGGLVAPAVLDAAHKTLPTLMGDFSDLVTRVRTGHMRSGEVASATITLTSLGADTVDVLFPVINPPQVAIVGAGAVVERPWVVDGTLQVRPVLTLTLAGDHRVSDGRNGSRLLRRVAELLGRPESL